MKEKIIWDTKGVFITLSESLDGQDLFQLNEKIYSDSQFDNLNYQIWDLTGLTEFNVKVEDMIKIAAHDKAAALSNPTMKVAIVATDEVTTMLVSLYEAESLDSPWESKMFNTVDEAKQWVL